MLWIGNSGGVCVDVNSRWREYIGSDPGTGSDYPFFKFVHPEDDVRCREAWTFATREGQLFEGDMRIRRHDGVFRWHHVRSVPDKKAGSDSKWCVVTFQDVDDHKKSSSLISLPASEPPPLPPNASAEQLHRAVEERTKQLQEALEQLEEFAYSIAHDMRAPLRAMHQYAEIVARDFARHVPDEAKVYLNKIMAASEKLDLLIREVLIYTRVSQGRIDLKPMSLERLLSEILISNPQMNPPAVELNARLPLHVVIGDETALTQVFTNLLTNAIKFVAKDRVPRITIWTEVIGNNVRISFKDNGIGIAERDKQRIFKMFERLQPEGPYEGSGIGLTIVRRAVERMGGILGVDSAEGEGSVFWIELKKGEM